MAVAPEPPAPAPAPTPPPAPAPTPAPPAPAPTPGLGNVPPAPSPVPPVPGTEPKARPEFLSENFWDATKGEPKLEAMAKSLTDMRAQISRGDHKPPATAADYKLDFANHTDPDVKMAAAAIFRPGEDGSPDPVLSRVQVRAHKEGVSQAGLAGIAEEFLKAQVELGLIPPPFDEKAEMAKLGAHGPAMLKNLLDFAEQEKRNGKWDDAEYQMFRDMLYGAPEARFFQKLLQDSGRIPEVQLAHLQQAAASPDASALDAEQAELRELVRTGKITDAQATERLDVINQKRAKIVGNAPTGVWPPPR